MLSDRPFTKENLDQYLKELAKEFRKRNGKSVPAEIIPSGSMSTKQGGSVSGTALPDSFPSVPYSPEEPLIQAGFPPLGSLQVKTRRSFSMAAEIVPPCFCTMAAAMARPMPKPPCFFLFREGSAR